MKQLTISLIWTALFLTPNLVLAADRVVIVPLGGTTGDATVEDVVRDKTFSSKTGKGQTGTRFPALLKKTGQTYLSSANDDFAYNKGISTLPRWTHMQPNSGGIYIFKPGYGYRDNNTGLIWLEDASESRTGITDAIEYCEELETVQSLPGFYLITDWRLPNIVELLSLVDYGQDNPPLPSDHHFSNVPTGQHFYWSSTVNAGNNSTVWGIDILSGASTNTLNGGTQVGFIMCVRD